MLDGVSKLLYFTFSVVKQKGVSSAHGKLMLY